MVNRADNTARPLDDEEIPFDAALNADMEAGAFDVEDKGNAEEAEVITEVRKRTHPRQPLKSYIREINSRSPQAEDEIADPSLRELAEQITAKQREQTAELLQKKQGLIEKKLAPPTIHQKVTIRGVDFNFHLKNAKRSSESLDVMRMALAKMEKIQREDVEGALEAAKVILKAFPNDDHLLKKTGGIFGLIAKKRQLRFLERLTSTGSMSNPAETLRLITESNYEQLFTQTGDRNKMWEVRQTERKAKDQKETKKKRNDQESGVIARMSRLADEGNYGQAAKIGLGAIEQTNEIGRLANFVHLVDETAFCLASDEQFDLANKTLERGLKTISGFTENKIVNDARTLFSKKIEKYDSCAEEIEMTKRHVQRNAAENTENYLGALGWSESGMKKYPRTFAVDCARYAMEIGQYEKAMEYVKQGRKLHPSDAMRMALDEIERQIRKERLESHFIKASNDRNRRPTASIKERPASTRKGSVTTTEGGDGGDRGREVDMQAARRSMEYWKSSIPTALIIENIQDEINFLDEKYPSDQEVQDIVDALHDLKTEMEEGLKLLKTPPIVQMGDIEIKIPLDSTEEAITELKKIDVNALSKDELSTLKEKLERVALAYVDSDEVGLVLIEIEKEVNKRVNFERVVERIHEKITAVVKNPTWANLMALIEDSDKKMVYEAAEFKEEWVPIRGKMEVVIIQAARSLIDNSAEMEPVRLLFKALNGEAVEDLPKEEAMKIIDESRFEKAEDINGPSDLAGRMRTKFDVAKLSALAKAVKNKVEEVRKMREKEEEKKTEPAPIAVKSAPVSSAPEPDEDIDRKTLIVGNTSENTNKKRPDNFPQKYGYLLDLKESNPTKYKAELALIKRWMSGQKAQPRKKSTEFQGWKKDDFKALYESLNEGGADEEVAEERGEEVSEEVVKEASIPKPDEANESPENKEPDKEKPSQKPRGYASQKDYVTNLVPQGRVGYIRKLLELMEEKDEGPETKEIEKEDRTWAKHYCQWTHSELMEFIQDLNDIDLEGFPPQLIATMSELLYDKRKNPQEYFRRIAELRDLRDKKKSLEDFEEWKTEDYNLLLDGLREPRVKPLSTPPPKPAQTPKPSPASQPTVQPTAQSVSKPTATSAPKEANKKEINGIDPLEEAWKNALFEVTRMNLDILGKKVEGKNLRRKIGLIFRILHEDETSFSGDERRFMAHMKINLRKLVFTELPQAMREAIGQILTMGEDDPFEGKDLRTRLDFLKKIGGDHDKQQMVVDKIAEVLGRPSWLSRLDACATILETRDEKRKENERKQQEEAKKAEIKKSNEAKTEVKSDETPQKKDAGSFEKFSEDIEGELLRFTDKDSSEEILIAQLFEVLSKEIGKVRGIREKAVVRHLKTDGKNALNTLISEILGKKESDIKAQLNALGQINHRDTNAKQRIVGIIGKHLNPLKAELEEYGKKPTATPPAPTVNQTVTTVNAAPTPQAEALRLVDGDSTLKTDVESLLTIVGVDLNKINGPLRTVIAHAKTEMEKNWKTVEAIVQGAETDVEKTQKIRAVLTPSVVNSMNGMMKILPK